MSNLEGLWKVAVLAQFKVRAQHLSGETEENRVQPGLSVSKALMEHSQYCSGDKIEKNEMGGICSAYGGEERRIQGFGGEI